MSLSNRVINMGDLRGAIYDFSLAGDVLPMHCHDETTVHISIVARGSFKARYRDGDKPLEVRTVHAGAILDWGTGVYHEFVALEPDSRLINIIKRMAPSGPHDGR